jgi:hypothetical protein
MRRYLRFSLRALLVLVTAIGALLGYEMQWIRARRDFVEEQKTRFVKAQELPPSVDFNGEMFLITSYPEHQWTNAPSLLWMFGERGRVVVLVVIDGDIKVPDGPYFPQINSAPPEVTRAEKLFPESSIYPVTWSRSKRGKQFVPVQIGNQRALRM